jgi:hypothetical protein
VSLEHRIKAIREITTLRYIMVGAVYVDLYAKPIDVQEFKDGEYSQLDEVRPIPGGSAYWAGRYLWEHYGQKSYLFSRLGGSDLLSNSLRKELLAEPWIQDPYFTTDEDRQCGVSIHLTQRNGDRTTFTHRGALQGLEWRSKILEMIKWRTDRGAGVIYISGYMRTNLCNELSDSLRYLSDKFLVCVDHGRFRSGENAPAARTLGDAFAEKLIDVYFCTHDGLKQFMTEIGYATDRAMSDEDYLKTVATRTELPRVTVVRSNPKNGPLAAFVLLDGTVTQIDSPRQLSSWSNHPGLKNAFNTAFVYNLITGPPEMPFEALIMGAASAGLENWANYSS